MSQYDVLWKYIQDQNQKEIRLTFSKIEEIIHSPMNHSFLTYKKDLLAYGYSVKKISLKEKWVLFQKDKNQQCEANILLKNVNKIHTTQLGVKRIQKNAQLTPNEDVIAWCKSMILHPEAEIHKKGKNWYVMLFPYEITINASSYTIITVHLK